MPTRSLKSLQKVVTTAGTRVALSATSKKVHKPRIKALAANTGVIYLGDVTVAASNGFQLAAGAEIKLEDLFWNGSDYIDLNAVYIDSAVNGEGISLVYVE